MEMYLTDSSVKLELNELKVPVKSGKISVS